MRSSEVDESKLFFNHVKQKEVVVNGSVRGVGFRNLLGIVVEASVPSFTVHTKDGDVSLDLSKAKIKRAPPTSEGAPSNEWQIDFSGDVLLVVVRL